ncbi:SDR family oxidoreductase [Streptomyces sp. NPDC019937]|uniref:SDR family oxidoreductase n=1 Tax=Streptomyces sp. NPDC019937 TaxID=3154787 RepID=UPI0033E65FA1
MNDPGMNVLILGGSGFLGTAVAQACERDGATVRVLSRGGRTAVGEGVRGDVRMPRLGLSAADLARVREETTHVVLCFGSVSWTSGPGEVLETHSSGMRSALAFLRELPGLKQAVHISSLLALGRAKGRITNRELYTGQRFRNWYEYGKYCAERLVRDTAPELPVGVVRFGPVLGPDPRGGRPDTRQGLPMVFPHLLAGYPVHLARRGEFPCWITDATSAAQIVLKALTQPIGRSTWTWFDPATPTLGEVFTEVCRPWGVVPKIVEAGPLGRLTRLIGERVGTPRELTEYTEPWFDLDVDVLKEIPEPWPVPDPDYLGATGEALRGGTERRALV